MDKIKKRLLKLAIESLLLVLLMTQVGIGKEYWQFDIPNCRIGPSLVYCFSQYFGLIYRSSDFGGKVGSSPDGVQWEQVAIQYEVPIFAREVAVHRDRLYVFGIADLDFSYHIYRSEDGKIFDRVYSHQESLNPILTIFSHKDFLYAVFSDGTMKRTTGEGPVVTWETDLTWPRPDSFTSFHVNSLFVFHDQLHMAFDFSFEGKAQSRVLQLSEGGSLKLVSSFDYFWVNESVHIPSYAVFDNKVYRQDFDLWTSTGGENNWSWDKEVKVLGEGGKIQTISGRLHYFPYQREAMALNEQNTWEAVGSIIYMENFYYSDNPHLASLIVNNKFIFHNGWSLQLGVKEVSFRPVQEVTLYAGQKGGVVMDFTFKVNIEDEVQLTVKNNGTAEAGRDIERVALMKVGTGEIYGLDKVDTRTWKTPRSFTIQDGDNFQLTADVSAHPQENATCWFAVDQDSIHFSNNPDHRLLSQLDSVREISLKSNPAGSTPSSLPDVLIFPQPATDHVKFMYDLDVPSDVIINIMNRNGLLVSQIKDLGKPAGDHAVTEWRAIDIAPGAYFAVIDITPAAGEKRRIKKTVLIR